MKKAPVSLYLATITVRYTCGTYIARLNGKVASSTSGSEVAARVLLGKLDPEGQYEVDLPGENSAGGVSRYSIVTKGGRAARRDS